MAIYRPAEALVDGTQICGAFVEVIPHGEGQDVLEMTLDRSPAARILSPDGEGLYVADGSVSRSFVLKSVAGRVACSQCQNCPEEDYSTTLDNPRRVPEETLPDLELTFAQSVMDTSGIRETVANCVARSLIEKSQ
ncbi:MAG: hypothetical protein ABIQ89_03545 [Candidatus Saccharimonadales bacterium]